MSVDKYKHELESVTHIGRVLESATCVVREERGQVDQAVERESDEGQFEQDCLAPDVESEWYSRTAMTSRSSKVVVGGGNQERESERN